MSIKRKPSWLERKLILSPLKQYLIHKFNLEIERNDTLQLKPPYIILSNHTNNWDPLFINCFVEEPICFVAAEPLFQNPMLKKVLDYTGAIPKTKSRADISTIRNLMLAKKSNRAIAIFPEGNRCWDGQTENTVYSTSKLIKMLNIPVVIGTIKGGYLTHPRWGDSDRKGKVSVSLEKKWDAGELASLDIEVIHKQLTEAIFFDELAWQNTQKIAYKGERLANYLERLLFICPSCKSVGTMHSEDQSFCCGTCHYSVLYNEYGYFEPQQKPLQFTYIHEWNKWQLQYMRAELSKLGKPQAQWKNAFQTEVKLYVAAEGNPFLLINTGNLSWDGEYIIFTPINGENTLSLSINQLQDVNIHMNNKLDFYHNGKSARFLFYHPRTSAYQWFQLIKLIQQI